MIRLSSGLLGLKAVRRPGCLNAKPFQMDPDFFQCNIQVVMPNDQRGVKDPFRVARFAVLFLVLGGGTGLLVPMDWDMRS
jgi:hypothetical protein